MSRLRLSLPIFLFFMLFILALTAAAQGAPEPSASTRPRTEGRGDLDRLRIAGGGVTIADARPFGTMGPVTVFVELSDPTLAEMWLAAGEGTMTTAGSQQYVRHLVARQAATATAVEQIGGQVLATYRTVFNGLAVEVPAEQIGALSRLPGVLSVEPAAQYRLLLDETVPWVGATAVQAGGIDGSGIRVAVVDSGIDYTHAHLGGSGEQADTNKAIAAASMDADPALFPNGKVIGGYDFVGSRWDGLNFTMLEPDANPMDDQAGGVDGHGTHVASIIAGIDTSNSGGVGSGVAPGAQLYALKVCSSVSAACSAVALRQAFDWAADPNGDLNLSDRADVMNLSLGASYGQTGDQDQAILDQLSSLGMIIAAAAGNSGDAPYAHSSPARAATVISVAETSTPGLMPEAEAHDMMVDSSVRGPSFDTNTIKPEIGAPGASRSASSGNQSYERFGGTSGATPMVTGALGLLLEARGGPGSLDWAQAKALLMNNAETAVWKNQYRLDPAPITRAGAGRLNIEAAVGARSWAYVVGERQPALSFGSVPVSAGYSATKRVQVNNLSSSSKTFAVSAALRFEADKNLGVIVKPSVSSLRVPARRSATFDVLLTVSGPGLLPPYADLLAGGDKLALGDNLTVAEVDGYVTLEEAGGDSLHLPFHFLPRQTAALAVEATPIEVPVGPHGAQVTISNSSSIAGQVEAYPLFEISPRLQEASGADEQSVDLHYVGSHVLVDPFGDGDNVYRFALVTYESRSHPINVRHLVYVDINQDGQDDWIVYNLDRGDGVWICVQYNIASQQATSYFYLDTALNARTMVLSLKLSSVADEDLSYDFRVEAHDAYFGTPEGLIRQWDQSPLDGGFHRHDGASPTFITDAYFRVIPANSSVESTVFAGLMDSTQSGILYRFYNGAQEAAAVPMTRVGLNRIRLPLVAANN